MKTTLVTLLVLLLAGIGIYGYVQNRAATAPVAPKNFSWTFTAAGIDLGDNPRTRVVLVVDGTQRVIGTYTGTCFELKGSSWAPLPNEESGFICWWAGGGTEVGVFRENGGLLVKEGQLDEGTAETPGVRGNFKVLFTL